MQIAGLDMRIIAGEFRGRKLLGPQTEATRPITDRVKQSLFDILSPRIEGAVVYDLFAGTGSMGLECLSRGARRVEFFEAERSAVARLRKNLAALGVSGEKGVVHGGDLMRLFAGGNAGGDDLADLIFLDPPYRFLRERAEELRALGEKLAARLNSDGVVVFRHDSRDSLELPGLRCFDRREYGSMGIEFLRRGE